MHFKLHKVETRQGTPIPWYGSHGILWAGETADVYALADGVTVKGVAHEITHPLLGEHHPWWHFCLRVFHGLRTWDHVDRAAFEGWATKLIQNGTITTPNVI